MKFSSILPLAALSTAFVLPPEEVIANIAIENHERPNNNWYQDVVDAKDDAFAEIEHQFEDLVDTSRGFWEQLSKSSKHAVDEATESSQNHWDELTDASKARLEQMMESSHDMWDDVRESSKDAFEDAWDYADETAQDFREKMDEAAFDAKSWLAAETDDLYSVLDKDHEGPPHHGRPPHHGAPGRGRRPHHPPHHGKSNLTVYQMIAESKYTTKLAELINEHDDLVGALNSTKFNYTVFAPIDKAFENIPEHAKKPSKEVLKAILSYHVVPDFYPASRVFRSRTAPTLLETDKLTFEKENQRIAFKVGLGGLSVNFYSRVIAPNIFATNGVIHGVSSIIVPPPSAVKIIGLLPGEFSTLELALTKTGLMDKFNTTDPKHPGGTLFAPSNFAFQKLGPKINAFLFSQYGLKYLKSLLEYHAVPDNTLYSDAYYKAKSKSSAVDEMTDKGYFHVDLPTLLKDRHLAIDIARYGRFISFKVNAFSRVTVSDGIAEDGVIHVVSDVIVPPKKIGGAQEYWDGSEMTVEELKERLEPYVAHGL